FIRLAEVDGGLHPQVVEIANASKGTQGVLDKLFSVESGLKDPSHEPIPFTQKNTKNTRQAVPAALAAIVEKENATPSFVHPQMWHLANLLDSDILVQIAGGEQGTGRHAANQLGLQAKWESLEREISRMKDFVGEMFTDGKPDISKPLYFEHVVWKQQRVGIATNTVNPQTSKIHRHMLYQQAWDTQVDTADRAQMENFFLRVGEGLGVKTDKKDNERSLAEALEKTGQPEIKAAVDVLVQVLQNPQQTSMSQEQQNTLLEGV